MFDKFVLIQLGTNHIFKVHAGNKLKKKNQSRFSDQMVLKKIIKYLFSLYIRCQ